MSWTWTADHKMTPAEAVTHLRRSLVGIDWQAVQVLASEVELLRAQRGAALARHVPAPAGEGMGRREDGTYGEIEPACVTCGSFDEYAVRWPCPTAKALGAEAIARQT